MPTPDELRQLVNRYAAAVTARDVDAVVALFADDAVQRDPASAPPNVGRDAIRTFFGNAVDASTGTDFTVTGVHTAGDAVAFNFSVVAKLGDAGAMTISGIEVFTVGADGRIATMTAYWDDADVTTG